MRRKYAQNGLDFHFKMFSVPENEKGPIGVHKLSAEKRPAEKNCSDSQFYFSVNSLKKFESLSNKAWFKKVQAGVNKLSSIMKNMAEKTALTTTAEGRQ